MTFRIMFIWGEDESQKKPFLNELTKENITVHQVWSVKELETVVDQDNIVIVFHDHHLFSEQERNDVYRCFLQNYNQKDNSLVIFSKKFEHSGMESTIMAHSIHYDMK